MYGRGLLVAALVAGSIIAPFTISADEGSGSALTEGFGDGRWRVESGVSTGFHSGRRDRTGDILVKGSIEYEWPVFARASLGLRAYPLFSYIQNDPSETLWGGGFGVVGRVYHKKEERRGFFAEAGANAIFHSNTIDGNSANMDFMLEGGVGYQFKNDWHVTLQVSHISNGGMAEDNAGANSVGLAVGYTF